MERADDIVQAFWFLAILVGLPFPIMMLVDIDRGRTEGIALAKTLEQLDTGHHTFSTQHNDPEDDLH